MNKRIEENKQSLKKKVDGLSNEQIFLIRKAIEELIEEAKNKNE